MLDGGQLLYDAWELVAGKRISVSMQEQLQKVGFVLLISLSILALFNDLQRYLSPWIFWPHSLAFLSGFLRK